MSVDAAYYRTRRRRMAYGTWDGLTPADEAKRHLDALLTAWNVCEIAREAGLSRDQVRSLQRRRSTRATVAAAVLAIPIPEPALEYMPLDVQARDMKPLEGIALLRSNGWCDREIGECLGMSTAAVAKRASRECLPSLRFGAASVRGT